MLNISNPTEIKETAAKLPLLAANISNDVYKTEQN